MNPWFARAAILLSSIVMVAIRAPRGRRSRRARVAMSRKGPRELVLLTLAWLGFVVPFIWVATPVLAFADYPLRPVPFSAGILGLALGLWLFARSHVDLGRNWSITLELREGHQLVTRGVYLRIRHPMYTALLLHSLGQALAVPNWVAGPSYFVAFALLFALRVNVEERMMLEQFGTAYESYMARTKRLVPRVW